VASFDGAAVRVPEGRAAGRRPCAGTGRDFGMKRRAWFRTGMSRWARSSRTARSWGSAL